MVMERLHAILEFPATGARRRLAAVRVRVEDTSRADAAADVVAEKTLTDVEVPAEGGAVEVDLDYPTPGPGSRFTVRAHGSASGSADFATGDFLTTRAVPAAADVRVPLQAI
ncbi:hypothetical protein GCM10017607_01590 [Microbacterium thalassium]|nr:hypothetical protein GCM10017607_01590 [Microbacterium thalassium]